MPFLVVWWKNNVQEFSRSFTKAERYLTSWCKSFVQNYFAHCHTFDLIYCYFETCRVFAMLLYSLSHIFLSISRTFRFQCQEKCQQKPQKGTHAVVFDSSGSMHMQTLRAISFSIILNLSNTALSSIRASTNSLPAGRCRITFRFVVLVVLMVHDSSRNGFTEFPISPGNIPQFIKHGSFGWSKHCSQRYDYPIWEHEN